MFCRALFSMLAYAVLVSPRLVSAQQPQHPIVRGVVVDSTNHPLKEAEVIATDSTNAIAATVRTDKNGAFIIRDLTPKTPYIFTARQVGFARGVSEPIPLSANDTLNLRFVLDAVTASLPTVSVIAKIEPVYRIDAAEIAKHSAVDALDVVLNYRTRMLGDVYKGCRPDTSHLTFRPARGSAILPKLAHPSDTLGQRPPRIFVNGMPHDEIGMKDVLSRIPSEDIAEMRYVSCDDTTLPVLLRNALFVILKPGKEY